MSLTWIEINNTRYHAEAGLLKFDITPTAEGWRGCVRIYGVIVIDRASPNLEYLANHLEEETYQWLVRTARMIRPRKSKGAPEGLRP